MSHDHSYKMMKFTVNIIFGKRDKRKRKGIYYINGTYKKLGVNLGVFYNNMKNKVGSLD